MFVQFVLEIMLIGQTVVILDANSFFNNGNSVIQDSRSLTNPHMIAQITDDFELRLVCNMTLDKGISDNDTLKRVVIADMANPTTLRVKMDYYPQTYSNKQCSHMAKETARGLGNVRKRIKSVECLLFNTTRTFLFALTLQGEITDDDLILWSCGIKYSGDKNYTVSMNRDAYTQYGLTHVIDPLIDIFNRPKPRIDLVVIPEATSPNIVTVGCTTPDLIPNSPFADHSENFSIMRPVQFTGPNGFFVKGDILGKRWISDHITACDFSPKFHIKSLFKSKIPVSVSRKCVHPADIVASCYDYNSSPVCGIRPKLTLFADREFVESKHFYVPSNKDVNGLILPDGKHDKESWLFPRKLRPPHAEFNVSTYDADYNGGVELFMDIYMEQWDGYNYPTIPLYRGHPEEENPEEFIYIPDPPFLLSLITKVLNELVLNNARYIKLIHSDPISRSFTCATGDINSDRNYRIFTVVHYNYIDPGKYHMHTKPQCGPYRNYVAVSSKNRPLVLKDNSLNLKGAVWENAWCVYGKIQPMGLSKRTVSYTVPRHNIYERYEQQKKKGQLLSNVIRLSEQGGKVIVDPRGYNDVSDCSAEDISNMHLWHNSTTTQASSYINGHLYERCRSQHSRCQAHLSQFEMTTTAAYNRWEQEQTGEDVEIECLCGQLPNPCASMTGAAHGVMASVGIPIEYLTKTHPTRYTYTDDRAVIGCQMLGGKSPLYSWNQLKDIVACGGEVVNYQLIPAPEPRIISKSEYLPKHIAASISVENKHKINNKDDYGELIIGIVCEEASKLCRENPKFEGRQMIVYNDTGEVVIHLAPSNNHSSITVDGNTNTHVFQIGMRQYARYISRIACMGHLSSKERNVMSAIALYRKYIHDVACRPEDSYYMLHMNDVVPIGMNETHWFYRCYLIYMDSHRMCPMPFSKTMIISINAFNNTVNQSTTGDRWGVVDGGGALYGDFAFPMNDTNGHIQYMQKNHEATCSIDGYPLIKTFKSCDTQTLVPMTMPHLDVLYNTLNNGNIRATCITPIGRFPGCGLTKDFRVLTMQIRYMRIDDNNGALYDDPENDDNTGWLTVVSLYPNHDATVSDGDIEGLMNHEEKWQVIQQFVGADKVVGIEIQVHENNHGMSPFNIFTAHLPSAIVSWNGWDDSMLLRCNYISNSKNEWIYGKTQYMDEAQLLYRGGERTLKKFMNLSKQAINQVDAKNILEHKTDLVRQSKGDSKLNISYEEYSPWLDIVFSIIVVVFFTVGILIMVGGIHWYEMTKRKTIQVEYIHKEGARSKTKSKWNEKGEKELFLPSTLSDLSFQEYGRGRLEQFEDYYFLHNDDYEYFNDNEEAF